MHDPTQWNLKSSKPLAQNVKWWLLGAGGNEEMLVKGKKSFRCKYIILLPQLTEMLSLSVFYILRKVINIPRSLCVSFLIFLKEALNILTIQFQQGNRKLQNTQYQILIEGKLVCQLCLPEMALLTKSHYHKATLIALIILNSLS